MKVAAHLILTVAAKAAMIASLLFIYGIAGTLLFVTNAPLWLHAVVGAAVAYPIYWAMFMRVPNPWGR